MSYDYFYGQSGELFSYFRIPKALFQDSRFRQLSTDARTLYGILLDRMSLSVKNGWLDEQGRVYIIYTVREVQEFNLTKRQLVCFGTAALIGVPLFFVLRDSGGNTAATLGMMAVMLPAFFLGMYEKNGQPMEKLLSYYVQSRFLRPKIRPYKTNNYYAILMKGGMTYDPVLEKDR